jgi:hypothetical protein
MAGISKSGVDLDVYAIGNLASGYLTVTDSKNEFNGNSLRNSDFAKVNWSCQGDNTWRTLFSNTNDFRGVLEIWGSDASSMDRSRYSFATTSPAYGVGDWGQDSYINGGWNTGSYNITVISVGNSYNINFQFNSYYSSSNVGSFYAHWRGVYS